MTKTERHQQRVVITSTNLPRLRASASLTVARLARLSGVPALTIRNFESGQEIDQRSRNLIREAIRPLVTPQVPPAVRTTISRLTRVGIDSWEDLPKCGGILVLFDDSARLVFVGAAEDIRSFVARNRRKPWFSRPLVNTIGYAEVNDVRLRTQVAALLKDACKASILLTDQMQV